MFKHLEYVRSLEYENISEERFGHADSSFYYIFEAAMTSAWVRSPRKTNIERTTSWLFGFERRRTSVLRSVSVRAGFL